MTKALSAPVAPQAPPGASEKASCCSSGKKPEGPPFADVLNNEQARTAVAEGKTGGDDTPKDIKLDDCAEAPEGACDDVAPVAPAVVPVPVAPAVPVAPTAPVAALPAQDAETAAPGTVPAGTPAATTAPAVAATPAQDAETHASPVAQAAVAATPGAEQSRLTRDAATAAATATAAANAAVDGEAQQPAAGETPDLPAQASAQAQAHSQAHLNGNGNAYGREGGRGQNGQAPVLPAADPQAAQVPTQPVASTPAAPATPAAAQASAAAAPALVAEAVETAGPAPANPAPPVSGAAPSQASQPAPAVAPPSPLNTADAVERIQAMVHLAQTRGTAHARLELHPAELGGVTIQLHVTADGLQANITADNAEALPLLQRAAGDLRSALESRGIDLRGLDFGLAPDAQAGAAHQEQQRRAQERAAFGTTAGGRDNEGDDDLTTTDTTTTRSTVGLPAGALVDVRA